MIYVCVTTNFHFVCVVLYSSTEDIILSACIYNTLLHCMQLVSWVSCTLHLLVFLSLVKSTWWGITNTYQLVHMCCNNYFLTLYCMGTDPRMSKFCGFRGHQQNRRKNPSKICEAMPMQEHAPLLGKTSSRMVFLHYFRPTTDHWFRRKTPCLFSFAIMHLSTDPWLPSHS